MEAAVEINELSSSFTSVLSEHLTPVIYEADSTIFHEGDDGGCAYVIERGAVEISKLVDGIEIKLNVLGPGELFGEMAPIDQQQRSASATAIEETELIPISPKHLRDTVANAHPLVHLLLRVLLDRVRSTHDHVLSASIPAAGNNAILSDDAYRATRERAVGRIKLERALHDALRRREFDLNYQPIVSMSGRHIVGFEALIRWVSPERGQVPPPEFIPVAEESGLITRIGLWVLEHACHNLHRFQVRFQKAFPEAAPLFMSVNVSGRQLQHFSDVDKLKAVISRVDIDPSQLKLEITEGVLMENAEVARVALQKLKALGLTLAVDDFGTGYSSLSYLQRFQLDCLKIDRSFVSTMLSDKGSDRIVRAIMGLAQSLNMEIVAEGVESPVEVTRLLDLGCDLGQGYLFSRPGTADQIMEMVSTPLTWSDSPPSPQEAMELAPGVAT